MANRYWVGGTASWNATAGSKWSTSSGGAGGEAVPTAADDVFLDGNSGASVVTIDTADALCRSLNCTGFTGTLTGNTTSLRVGDGTVGHFTLSAGMTFSHAFSLQFHSTTTGNQITLNGKSLGAENVAFSGAGGAWTLMDAFVTTAKINIIKGTLDTNGQAVTCNDLVSEGSDTRVLTLGASVVTLTGTGTVLNLSAITTINAGTSEIVISDTSSSTKTVVISNRTVNDVTISGGGSGVVAMNMGISGVINTLAIAGPKTVQFLNGATSVIGDLTASGSGVVVRTDGVGLPVTLSKPSGTVSVSNVTLRDINVTGGATWNAVDSEDLGGNTGWNFIGANAKSMLQFFASS